MPGFPAPFIKFREVDANGDPLAGGKLYSYAAGTTTPLATYTSRSLGTANANPVVLDASGRADVWVEDGIGYKFILKDAAGATIWTEDNVQVPDIAAAAVATVVPTGGIVPYVGTSAPTDWLLCDGSAVSRTTYSALFAITGTTYGSGNGSTTFNVPDLRQRFPIGKAASGTAATLGSSGGTIDHVHAGPSHTHTVTAHTHTLAHTHTVAKTAFGPALVGIGSDFTDMVTLSGGGGGGAFGPTVAATTSAASVADTGSQSLTTNSSGTADTGTANPPFLALNFIVKT